MAAAAHPHMPLSPSSETDAGVAAGEEDGADTFEPSGILDHGYEEGITPGSSPIRHLNGDFSALRRTRFPTQFHPSLPSTHTQVQAHQEDTPRLRPAAEPPRGPLEMTSTPNSSTAAEDAVMAAEAASPSGSGGRPPGLASASLPIASSVPAAAAMLYSDRQSEPNGIASDNVVGAPAPPYVPQPQPPPAPRLRPLQIDGRVATASAAAAATPAAAAAAAAAGVANRTVSGTPAIGATGISGIAHIHIVRDDRSQRLESNPNSLNEMRRRRLHMNSHLDEAVAARDVGEVEPSHSSAAAGDDVELSNQTLAAIHHFRDQQQRRREEDAEETSLWRPRFLARDGRSNRNNRGGVRARASGRSGTGAGRGSASASRGASDAAVEGIGSTPSGGGGGEPGRGTSGITRGGNGSGGGGSDGSAAAADVEVDADADAAATAAGARPANATTINQLHKASVVGDLTSISRFIKDGGNLEAQSFCG